MLGVIKQYPRDKKVCKFHYENGWITRVDGFCPAWLTLPYQIAPGAVLRIEPNLYESVSHELFVAHLICLPDSKAIEAVDAFYHRLMASL
jgi:hypothetical protein